MAKEKNPPAEESAAQPGAAAPTGQQRVNEAADLEAFYANFFLVTGSPEEIVLDFGLKPQPYSSQPQTVTVSRRLALSPYTAKRLANALSMTVARHEQTFGALEIDPNKRVQPQRPSR